MHRTLRFAAGLVAIALAATGMPLPAGAAPEGQIIIAQGADPTTLDPHMHAENFTFAVVHNVFDHLVRRTVKDGQLAHEPGLASSWTSVNPTTWEFKLRPGVKFHNGEELNAEAVKFSIERVLNPDQKARWRWAFADIERVEVVDPLTLRIVTKRPSRPSSRTSRTPCPSCRRSTSARRATPTWPLTRWARGRSSSSAGARTMSWCSKPMRRTGAARRR
jgi:ABC-type transport system substrate-binding protein